MPGGVDDVDDLADFVDVVGDADDFQGQFVHLLLFLVLVEADVDAAVGARSQLELAFFGVVVVECFPGAFVLVLRDQHDVVGTFLDASVLLCLIEGACEFFHEIFLNLFLLHYYPLLRNISNNSTEVESLIRSSDVPINRDNKLA